MRPNDRLREFTVVPGWSKGPDSEFRDSGFDAEFIVGAVNRPDPVASTGNDGERLEM
jgi:hypothetical protein